MKYISPLIVVDDMERSKQFYGEVLGLCVICDFGANVTLTGGMSLQTRESWKDFIHKPDGQIVYHGNDAELYFEEADFDGFVEKLHSLPIEYVHDVQEHPWGQRGVRFYDPDYHIIEVGEPMENVCARFQNQGLSPEEIAVRMDIPLEMVKELLA